MTVLAEPQFEEAVDLEPSPRPRRRIFAVILHPLSIVLLLTVLGAVLRFAYLDRPPLWGDEAATFMRVCGTFGQLVDELVIEGFSPLHYLLYWWIAQHTPLTPIVMRLAPAIAGTLMIPTMYWLAVQLVSRPTAVLVAAFTACSAYLLNYSRDAKMYSELWLFVTLNMASLLWWLRVRTRLSWWAWVVSGIAMLGIQLVALGLLAIELIVVLTARRPNWLSLGKLLLVIPWLPFAAILAPFGLERRGPGRWFAKLFQTFNWPPLALFLLGMGLIIVGPVIYFSQFSVYLQRIYDSPLDRMRWGRTGIGWVEAYNVGRDGVDLLNYTGTAFLYNWEWPQPLKQSEVRERTLKLLKAAGIAMGSLLLIGVFPWRWWHRRWRHDPITTSHPSMRHVLWLTAWIALPAYGFYCASQNDAAWPIEWISAIALKQAPPFHVPAIPNIWQHWPERESLLRFMQSWREALSQLVHAFTIANIRWWLIVPLLAGAAGWMLLVPLPWRDRFRRGAIAGQLALFLLLLCVLVRVAVPEPLPGSVWMPRYLGYIWPAFAITVCALLMRLPTRPLRWGAIALLLIVNLVQHEARVFDGSEPPTDLMARDAIISHANSSDTRMYFRIGYRRSGEPGAGVLNTSVGRYYLAIYTGRKVQPIQMRNFASGFERDYGVFFAQPKLPFESIVANSLRSSPKITRLIVWDQLDPGQIDLTDRLAEKLDPGWKRISQTLYPVRDHWTWRDLFTARRRVYQRAAPATQPRP